MKLWPTGARGVEKTMHAFHSSGIYFFAKVETLALDSLIYFVEKDGIHLLNYDNKENHFYQNKIVYIAQ